MESIISTFHIDWKIIIAQVVNFGVVFVVLYIYALKPLSKLMKERSEKIQTGVSDAKKSHEMLQKATKEYEDNAVKLRQTAIEAQKELAVELDQMRTQNLDKIKQDHEEWNKKRMAQMEADKKALVESAKAEIAELAILAAKKVMEEKRK